MDPIFLDLGFVQIYWYSILIIIGMLIAGVLIFIESKRFAIDKDKLSDLIFYTMLFGLIGARIYFVLFHFDYYLKEPTTIFQIWNGGMAIHGGIIAGAIVIYVYCKRQHINIYRMMDIVAPGLMIAQAIGRWGNFLNQETYGPKTSISFLKSLHLPNFIIEGMYIKGEYYQPTFLYESLWCIIGFVLLLILRRRPNIKIGQLVSIYFIWYGFGRFFIEGLRQDSLMLGPIKMAQLVSIGMILGGIVFLAICQRKAEAYNTKGEIQ